MKSISRANLSLKGAMLRPSCGPRHSCAWMLLVNVISRHAMIEVKKRQGSRRHTRPALITSHDSLMLGYAWTVAQTHGRN